METSPSIYHLWIEYSKQKCYSTRVNYNDALKRFIKDLGENVTFDDITPEFVEKWRNKMIKSLSRTTCNIYLRNFSAILNVAYNKGYIKRKPRDLFKGMSIFSVRSSNTRKNRYISVMQWTNLWNFFLCRGEGYEEFEIIDRSNRGKIIESLGLMLFMYLANGMNLVDMCFLRFEEGYFDETYPRLNFVRKKLRIGLMLL